MLEEKFTQQLETTYDVSDMQKHTIDGEIGETTFYGKELTREEAQQKYDDSVWRMNFFWKSCRDTYTNQTRYNTKVETEDTQGEMEQ